MGLPESRAWYYNLYLPLLESGHEIVRFDYDLRPHFQNLNPADPAQKMFIERNRPALEEALLGQLVAAHRKKPVDLFFSYFYSACVRPEIVREIRRMGIVAVNWYCNAAHQFHLVEEIAPAYDYCLVPEKFRLEDYRRIGARPVYCQEAANPDVYRPYDLPREFDVTFVGQAYGDRFSRIRYLLDRGIDVRVWGSGWKRHSAEGRGGGTEGPVRRVLRLGEKLMTSDGRKASARRLRKAFGPRESGKEDVFSGQDRLPDSVSGDPLSDEEMIRMYSRSRVNLGFSTCGDTVAQGERILQVRLRDFEVPMSGGFYVVEYMQELEEFFEIGREIVCYTCSEELADKALYYLRHDAERETIRKAGRERALRDHTWKRRFHKAFREMGLL